MAIQRIEGHDYIILNEGDPNNQNRLTEELSNKNQFPDGEPVTVYAALLQEGEELGYYSAVMECIHQGSDNRFDMLWDGDVMTTKDPKEAASLILSSLEAYLEKEKRLSLSESDLDFAKETEMTI